MDERELFFTSSGNARIRKVIKPEKENKNNILESTFSCHFNTNINVFYVTDEISARQRIKGKTKKRQRQRDNQIIANEISFFNNYIVNYIFDKTRCAGNECLSFQPKQLKEYIDNQYKDQLVQNTQMFCIVGSIGCGKTTYIRKLLHEFHNDFIKRHDASIFSIDLFEHENEFLVNPEDTLFKQMLESFKGQFKKQLDSQNINQFIEDISVEMNTRNIIITIDGLDSINQSTNRKIFHAIENSEEDKHLIKWMNKNSSIINAVRRLEKAIQKFNNTESSTTKICTIYALRPNTYETLQSIGGNSNRFNDNEKKVIWLNPSDDFVSKVLKKRIDFIKDEFNKLPGDREKKNALSEYDLQELDKNLESMSKACVSTHLHGLRHLMNNIKDFVSSKYASKKHPQWMHDVFLYLDGKNIYEQGESGISNIFLVNLDKRRDAVIPGDSYPKSIIEKHPYTLWLKYLVACHVLSKESFQKGIPINYNQIYNADFTKITKHLYLFCLYSMSEIVHGRLISSELQMDDTCQLKTTDRLIHSFSNDYEKFKNGSDIIFFDFTYLSVIVDDKYLQYPKLLKNDIPTEQFVYKNFFPSTDEENKEWISWLKRSITKVLFFVQLLESSLNQYEKHLFDEDLLEKIPDFERIKASLYKQIEYIAKDLNMDISVLTQHLSQTKELVKKKSKEIDQFYRDYYNNKR